VQQIDNSLLKSALRGRSHHPRSSPRKGVNRRAVLTLPRSGKPHPVLLVDVSSGGACVQTDVELRVGDEVLLRAEMPPDVRVAVTCLITDVRAKRDPLYRRYGLRFIGVDPSIAAALAGYVNGTKS
jgi:hypothetical protein